MKPVFDLEGVYAIRYPGAVDADGHVLEPANVWEDYIEARYRDRALRFRTDADGLEYLEIAGAPSRMTARGFPATLGRMGQTELELFEPHPDRTYMKEAPYGSMDADERLKLLDAEGLEAAVLYPTLGILWEAECDDIELSQAYCRAYNRWIADFCRPTGGRLIPIAHLSLADPEAAAAELRRAVQDGCRGAFVVPFTIQRRAHGDPFHDPDYRAAQDLDVPIALHPAFEPFALQSRRFENREKGKNMWEAPQRLLMAVTAAEGVRHAFTTFFDYATFDRFPKLKLVVLESGAGWIGYWLNRIDAAYAATVLGKSLGLSARPSDYFMRQCWISADPDETMIPALAAQYGVDRFFWASDYPHADHTAEYLPELEKMVGQFSDADRAKLIGGNVRAVYGF